jgi:hypothetical protein
MSIQAAQTLGAASMDLQRSVQLTVLRHCRKSFTPSGGNRKWRSCTIHIKCSARRSPFSIPAHAIVPFIRSFPSSRSATIVTRGGAPCDRKPERYWKPCPADGIRSEVYRVVIPTEPSIIQKAFPDARNLQPFFSKDPSGRGGR